MLDDGSSHHPAIVQAHPLPESLPDRIAEVEGKMIIVVAHGARMLEQIENVNRHFEKYGMSQPSINSASWPF